MAEDIYQHFDFTAIYIYAVQIFLSLSFPFFTYMKLWRGRENICKIFELISNFSLRWGWQGIAGGRVWKTWRTTSTSASALPDGTKPVGTQGRRCGTSALTIRHSMTCVWNTLWAGKRWCLDGNQWIPREILAFVLQWRQGQVWPLFFALSSCGLQRDIFLENQVDVAWWKFRPQGNGVDYLILPVSW